MKTDCVFLLADKQMLETFEGFLGRDKFHLSLGTRFFTYKTHAPDRRFGDSGIFEKGHDFLERYRSTCHHAIVVLDHQWEGAPTPEIIRQSVKSKLMGKGWARDSMEVIVIEPELEVWLWQDSPHIARAFKEFDYSPDDSRKWLEARGFWEATALKPAQPKEAFELLCRASRTPRSSAVYQEIARQVSVRKCIDPAFCLLRETLQRWFPAG
jgi:hypothetical protein